MSYSVVMRSDKNAGGTQNSRKYAFDWTPFEEGAYEVTFSIKAKMSSAAISDQILAIELPDLGATFQTFTAGEKISSQNSHIIGVFMSTGGASASAGFGDNAPTKILSKPRNNIYTVNLYHCTTDGNFEPVTDGNIKGYYLILNFKRC